MESPAQILSISRRVSSRASTTVLYPRSSRYFAPSRSWTTVWVEAWRGRAGYRSRKRRITAGSWMITASAPAAAISSAAARSSAVSPSVTRVFTVTYTRVPRSWQKRTVPARSSKFSAFLRALKFLAPRYTASAPHRAAAVTAAKVPAGARTMGSPPGISFRIKAVPPRPGSR